MGARMHYGVPRVLNSEGRLAQLYTDICASAGWPRALSLLPSLLLPSKLRRLSGRIVPDIPRQLLSHFSGFGIEYQQRRSAAHTLGELTATHLWAGEKFCQLVLAQEIPPKAGLYCFNSAGLELLQDWRQRGQLGVVEQTIAPRRTEETLLLAEAEAFPGWEAARQRDMHVSAYIEREEAEWQEAGKIICGSDFVRDRIIQCGGPAERCVVVPYGVPLDQFRAATKPKLNGRKLRVLTVGEVCLRKGAHYVMSVAQRLGEHVEFRMVGPVGLLPQRAKELAKYVQLLGAVPRGEVVRHFDWADVFLLPSLCEGSATVTYEALAAGLPVIATPNTGSIVEDGVSGFVVPVRDSDAIVLAIERFLVDTSLLNRMRAEACTRSPVGSLTAYGKRLIRALDS